MPVVAYSDACLMVWNGLDALKFIDGLSTNKIIDMKSGEARQTVFTTSKAKIIDIVTVFHMNSFIAVQGHQSKMDQLMRHVTPRILDQDVQITDVTLRNDFYVRYGLEQQEFGSIESLEGITYGHVSSFYSIMIASKGTPCDVTSNLTEFDQWRIEQIIPWHGSEITEKYHPLACGLKSLVHPAKGCYIGQEVLTRMSSRGKQGKLLVKVETSTADQRFITTLGEVNSLAITRP
ncbi:MAG: hypothetical protein CMA63_08220 [Euryarchaeota archaeon]|nr:hypothetical protein [Euryarchaeota archaeon]|tara:strand:+ start:4922 stop:5623 length:702 start_codon:yes stop_codon:yes gene_type:complete